MSRFFLIILILPLFYSLTSFANDEVSNPYIIEGVKANAFGEDPSEARDLALKQAKKDAVAILLGRLNYPLEIADELGDIEIFKMIRSQQIDNEEIVGNQYIADLNIVFSKDFVEDVMERNNYKTISTKNIESSLLILAQEHDGEVDIWGENNSWSAAVKNNLKAGYKSSLIIPSSDIENISIINSSNLKTIDYRTIEPMFARYGVNSTYITTYSYDKDLNEIYIDITYIRSLQKKTIKLKFVNTNFLEKDELLDVVAKKTISYLISLDHSRMSDDESLEKIIAVPINGLGNYLMIKNKIEKSGVLQLMKLNVISKDYFMISANFKDNDSQAAQDFKEIGLNLEKKSSNYYILSQEFSNEI